MPRNQFQRMFFAFVTVVITVHAYVFYSLYVVNGQILHEYPRAYAKRIRSFMKENGSGLL